MTDRICPKSGKRMLKRQEADRVVTLAARRVEVARVPISTYRCPECGRWHTSGMSQLEHRVRMLVREAA